MNQRGEWVKRPICPLPLKTKGFVVSEILSTPFFYAIASWKAEEMGLVNWLTIDKQCIVYQ